MRKAQKSPVGAWRPQLTVNCPRQQAVFFEWGLWTCRHMQSLHSEYVIRTCMNTWIISSIITNRHWDPLPCATVKVPPFYLATFQGRANTQAGWIYLFFSVPVFTTGLVTVICPSPLLFGLFVFFSSPWSRDISFFVRVYYSCLFSQTVCTVLLSLSQYSLHEPVLWTSSLPSPGYFSIPSDWRRVPNI